MEKKCPETHSHPPQQQQKQKQNRPQINLKKLPPIYPPTAFSIPYNQVKQSKTITTYVPTVAKPRPEEEGVKVKKFDYEANTEADLLAEKQLQQQQEEENNDGSSVCSIKHIDPNVFVKKIDPNIFVKKIDPNIFVKKSESKLNCENTVLVDESDEIRRVSTKSQLHEVCAANNWKPPLYECCKEEGPCHQRLFTFKVIVEIEGAESMVLECYGASRQKKKLAAEHAAEGALWYLKLTGYFPIKKMEKQGKKNN